MGAKRSLLSVYAGTSEISTTNSAEITTPKTKKEKGNIIIAIPDMGVRGIGKTPQIV